MGTRKKKKTFSIDKALIFFMTIQTSKKKEEEEERRMLACHCNLPDTRRPNMINTYIHSKRATNISDYR
jgi:hypothetical protein